MSLKSIFLFYLILPLNQLLAQAIPLFGDEKKVEIAGLTFDAMEPFISNDGSTLFFNSLNSGGNTNLYYALRINDSTFTYMGLVEGCYDSSPNHLDGVASLDMLNNFYWVSLRNYPIQIENLHKGNYSSGNVSDITRVYGDFNSYIPGWLIMDAAITHQGNELYYCNAFFNNCTNGTPCETQMGVALYVNDSTFNKAPNSDFIFQNINDTNYINYAPQVSNDGLELYFTRLQLNSINTEICVSVRSSLSESFGSPTVIHSNIGFVPEAACLTSDNQIIYYHQKDASGIFHIYSRRKTSSLGLNQNEKSQIKFFPNPANDFININLSLSSEPFMIEIYSSFGQKVISSTKMKRIDISTLNNGLYQLKVIQNRKLDFYTFIKN